MTERVVAYIDGFNMYFGLRAARWRRFYWLNQQLLAQNLIRANQTLTFTKYFTSRITRPADKQRRQAQYLEALETLDDFQIYYGHYQSNLQRCRKCGNKLWVPNEKMTDVNIAVELLSDAYQDIFDVALLISADSDLSAPVRVINTLFDQKRVVVAFPPHRYSVQLQGLAHAFIRIGRGTISKSVFPDRIQKADGFILTKPTEWK